MRQTQMFAIAALAALVVVGCSKPKEDAPINPKDAPVVAKNAPEIIAQRASLNAPGDSTVREFDERVKQYLAMRDQLAATLKKLPDKASPQEIDSFQRQLLAKVADARKDAKRGDIFLPEMQTFIRGLVRRVLTGPDGPRIKASLMDENPMGVKIDINLRYPDTIPLSTMPPDVLGALPKLPADLEYRFLGNRLVLLDVQAHLIVDYVDNTFDL